MVRWLIYEFFHKIETGPGAQSLRLIGKNLFKAGLGLQGASYQEKIQPSLRGVLYRGSTPNLDSAYFVAPNSIVLGSVKVGLEVD